MSNYLLVGTAGANVDYGTEGAGYLAIGTIVSAERNDTGDKLEIKDRYGNVVAVIYFNNKGECSIDVIFDSTVTLPTRGAVLSLCGLTDVLCDSIKHKWENDKERMITIAATYYAGVTPS
jgi:hypothetical protein